MRNHAFVRLAGVIIICLGGAAADGSSLVGAWDFEDGGAGGVTADVSGVSPALDGVFSNALVVNDAERGLVLNPNNGGVLLGTDSKLYYPYSITVQYWHKMTNPNEQWRYVVGCGGGGPRHFNCNGGMIFAVQTSDSGWNPINVWRPNFPEPQTWHHVVATYDGAYLYGYIDGELIAQVYRGGTINSHTNYWSIGNQWDNAANGSWGTAWCSDLIDDVAIWTGYAPQSVVQGLYYGTYTVHNAPIEEVDLLGDYPPGDYDRNGFVNEADLKALADMWLADCTVADCGRIDANGDNLVNFADYSDLAGNWLYDEGTGKTITVEPLMGAWTFKVDSDFTTVGAFSHNWPEPSVVPVAGFAATGTIFQDFGGHSVRESWMRTNPDRWDYSTIATRINFILTQAPDTLMMPWLNITAPQWWVEDPANATELEIVDDGSGPSYYFGPDMDNPGPYPSLASEKWRQDMTKALENFLDYLYLSGYMENMGGFKLSDVGCGGENLHRHAHRTELAGYGVRTQHAFRDWLRAKYHNDINALEAMWNNTGINSFDNILTPSPARRKAYTGTFRDTSQYMDVIDFELFFNDLLVDTIDYFAGVIKRKTNGTKPVGAFYCYMYEWSGNPEDGHQALRRYNESENLDFVWQTASYEDRAYITGGDVLRGPAYSNQLHGKQWVNSNDTATHLASYLSDFDKIRLGYTDTVARNKRMFLRSAGFNICNGGFLQEFFALHDQWYNDPALVAAAGDVNGIYERSKNFDRGTASEILVVSDEVSCSYTSYSQWDHPLLKSCLRDPQIALTQMGAPSDQILLDDIALLPNPDQYKLVIFLNCWNLTDAQRALVDSLKNNGRVLMFCYATGYFNENQMAVANMESLMGNMDLSVNTSETLYRPRMRTTNDHPLGQAILARGITTFGPDESICKRIWANVGSSERIAYDPYYSSHETMAIKDLGTWQALYAVSPDIPATVYREIARYAGVHIYNDVSETFYANKSYVAIHPNHGETTLQSRTIYFPLAVNIYDAETEALLESNTTSFTRSYYGGESKVFRYEPAP